MRLYMARARPSEKLEISSAKLLETVFNGLAYVSGFRRRSVHFAIFPFVFFSLYFKANKYKRSAPSPRRAALLPAARRVRARKLAVLITLD